MLLVLKYWRVIALGCALAAIMGLWLAVGHFRKEAAQQRFRAETAEKLAKTLTDLRAQDQANALASYNTLAANCRADLKSAIKSGRAIEGIVNAPSPPDGAPRGLVDAARLRDILGQQAAD